MGKRGKLKRGKLRRWEDRKMGKAAPFGQINKRKSVVKVEK